MVKELLSLLIGGSVLVYGGYHSIKLAFLSKPRFASSNSSNIDLSEEKWVKPVVKPPTTVPVAPPTVPKIPKKSGKKPKKKEEPPTCVIASGRLKVQSSGHLSCGSSSRGK